MNTLNSKDKASSPTPQAAATTQQEDLNNTKILQSPDWGKIHIDSNLQQAFKASLQQHVSTVTHKEAPTSLVQVNADFVATILAPEIDQTAAIEQLEQLFNQQKNLYHNIDIATELRKRQYINKTGLVMSPDHCITTLRDYQRVSRFIQGVHCAINERLKNQSSISIAYPACGPFAPLLMPLLSYYQEREKFTPDQLKITLIDIQEGATQTLKMLVKAHNIESYIDAILCQDACDHQAKEHYDLVVLEAMQHGFSREGHLRLARHYSHQLKSNGILIPQKIVLNAALNNAQLEYVDQWKNSENSHKKNARQARVLLGEILTVEQDFLRTVEPIVLDNHTELVKCNTLCIPAMPKHSEQKMLIITSRINIWGDLWLEEYESGITHPLPDQNICINFTPNSPQPGDVLANSGDDLTFYYCVNGLPGFFATCAKASANAANAEQLSHAQ